MNESFIQTQEINKKGEVVLIEVWDDIYDAKSIKYVEYSVVESFASKEDAENHIINNVFTEFFSYKYSSFSLSIGISRVANQIANKTLRGAGNTMVYPPSMSLSKITKHNVLQMKFHCSPYISQDKLLIFYSGPTEYDQPFVWVEGKGIVFHNEVRKYGIFIDFS